MVSVPPTPLHVSVYVRADVTLDMVVVPRVPRVPFQSPDAVHEVTPDDVHSSVTVPPDATDVGLTTSESFCVLSETATVTVFDSTPPVPRQVSVNVFTDVMFVMVSCPLVPRDPVQSPSATQLVALVVDHVITVELPERTLVGSAESVIVGVDVLCPETETDTLADFSPPPPAQVMVNVVYAATCTTTSVPLVFFVPVHPPDAVQLFACDDDQVSTVDEPA